MEIVVSAITDGVTIGFAIGKLYGVNQKVVDDFEEDTDFWNPVFLIYYSCTYSKF